MEGKCWSKGGNAVDTVDKKGATKNCTWRVSVNGGRVVDSVNKERSTTSCRRSPEYRDLPPGHKHTCKRDSDRQSSDHTLALSSLTTDGPGELKPHIHRLRKRVEESFVKVQPLCRLY